MTDEIKPEELPDCPECGGYDPYTAAADCPTCHGRGGDPDDE